MKADRMLAAAVLIGATLGPVGSAAADDPPPILGSKTRNGAELRGKDRSQHTRKSVIMGHSRDVGVVRKVGRKPGVGKVGRCVVGVYDGTSCVEPRSRVEIYPRDDRVQPRRPVRPDRRLITTTVVRTAVRDVSFPKLSVRIQPPGGKTLLNLKTIVYTKPEPFETVVPILTWPVTVRATPQSYTWHFGDGTTQTTDTPGAPYPSFDVFHEYQRRGTVQLRVTVHYAARYRTPGDTWRSIGTVPITGPATSLLVCESNPTLVDPNNPNPPNPPTDPDNPCTHSN